MSRRNIYALRYSNSTTKNLKHLSPDRLASALKALEKLRTDPLLGKSLKGKHRGKRRLRVRGDLRIVYVVDKEERTITVEWVETRGQAY